MPLLLRALRHKPSAPLLRNKTPFVNSDSEDSFTSFPTDPSNKHPVEHRQSMACSQSWSLIVALNSVEEGLDKLAEAGCRDSSPGELNGYQSRGGSRRSKRASGKTRMNQSFSWRDLADALKASETSLRKATHESDASSPPQPSAFPSSTTWQENLKQEEPDLYESILHTLGYIDDMEVFLPPGSTPNSPPTPAKSRETWVLQEGISMRRLAERFGGTIDEEQEQDLSFGETASAERTSLLRQMSPLFPQPPRLMESSFTRNAGPIASPVIASPSGKRQSTLLSLQRKMSSFSLKRKQPQPFKPKHRKSVSAQPTFPQFHHPNRSTQFYPPVSSAVPDPRGHVTSLYHPTTITPGHAPSFLRSLRLKKYRSTADVGQAYTIQAGHRREIQGLGIDWEFGGMGQAGRNAVSSQR